MSFAPSSEPGFHRSLSRRLPVATFALLGISGLVALWTRVGQNDAALSHLLITNFAAKGQAVQLPEMARGEIWRAITPIFLHFGVIHLVFNLLWLKDLGTAIETLEGTGKLLALTVIAGVLSNFGQLYVGGPFFGGMSGVVYALLGYAWMRSHFSRGAGYAVANQTALFMLAWFVACYLGLIGQVANTAHAVGLAVGALWGFASARAWQSRRSMAR